MGMSGFIRLEQVQRVPIKCLTITAASTVNASRGTPKSKNDNKQVATTSTADAMACIHNAVHSRCRISGLAWQIHLCSAAEPRVMLHLEDRVQVFEEEAGDKADGRHDHDD